MAANLKFGGMLGIFWDGGMLGIFLDGTGLQIPLREQLGEL